ncbi:hypothetical protein [Chitinophaga sp. GbtcB8]|nr:hypothetical protein [Chitinophaga sp. GbtcB8]
MSFQRVLTIPFTSKRSRQRNKKENISESTKEVMFWIAIPAAVSDNFDL